METKKMKKTNATLAIANAKGMTIVELMIVLTIIAGIMGIVGFSVFGALTKASVQEAGIEIDQFKGMVNAYYLSSSPKKFPDSLEDLTKGPAPLTKEIPKDPWGSDYVYKKTGNTTFEIYSIGPDGQEGTEDDVRPDGE